VDCSKAVTRPLSNTSDRRLALPPARSQKVEAFRGLPDSRTTPAICGLDAEVEKVRLPSGPTRAPCGRARHARDGACGLDAGEANTETVYRIAPLRGRSPRCLQLAISDAYQGLKRSWHSR